MKLAVTLLSVLVLAGVVCAGTVSVVSSDRSSQYGGNGPSRVHDGDTATFWMSHGNSDNEGSDDDPWISFTFDKVYNLASVDVWNFAHAGHEFRGMQTAEILLSTDGTNFSTSAGTHTFLHNEHNPQAVDLGGLPALAVMFDIKANFSKTFEEGTSYEGPWANGSIVELNEVLFTSEAQIPEPATMVLLGLGGLAVLKRRRRT